MSSKRLPIGTSDFKIIREKHSHYIDKSLLIKDLMELDTSVFLFPRPRRFGKTSNLSMLRYFYEKTEVSNASLFEGLAITQHPEVMRHQGQYPVIYLTFKDVKDPSWAGASMKVISLLSQLYSKHSWILEHQDVAVKDRLFFEQILSGNILVENMGEALQKLMEWLHQATGKKVIVLIDEYDVLIQSGYLHDYDNDSVSFMRSLLTGALKDNSNLEKGVLTGILRVAKESIFSGLNNLMVYSLLSYDFYQYFGFTQTETFQILRDFGLEAKQQIVEDWYNGYRFGDQVIYNPWSVLNFISKAAEGPQPHWINTSGNELIRDLVTSNQYNIGPQIEDLLQGKSIITPLYEDISFRDLENTIPVVWSLLVFSGYLRPKAIPLEPGETDQLYQVEIPNLELISFFRRTFQNWIHQRIESASLNQMLNHLVKGDLQEFEQCLSELVISVMSFYDVMEQEPERVYHAFVLGVLLNLQNRYEIRSNRESGYGRYDVMLIPKNKNQLGFVFEFKKQNRRLKETPKKALQSALEQIEKLQYATELKAQGVNHFFEVAVVVDQKKMWIDWKEKN